jgi:hypothetical protein
MTSLSNGNRARDLALTLLRDGELKVQLTLPDVDFLKKVSQLYSNWIQKCIQTLYLSLAEMVFSGMRSSGSPSMQRRAGICTPVQSLQWNNC